MFQVFLGIGRLRSAGLTCVAGLLLFATSAWAEDQPAQDQRTINVIAENDSFLNHSDRHYTNGLYGSWTSAVTDDKFYSDIADKVMLGSNSTEKGYRYGYFGGQSMFTPQGLGSPTPDRRDRPYAGWLFGGMRAYRQSDHGFGGTDVLDRAEVSAGIVGPLSGAGSVQKGWHDLWGFTHPNGWGSQLPNEPGLVLTEQRIWRKHYPLSDQKDFTGLEFEALPQVTASVGNVFTYAGVGAMLRVGQNLNIDWGPARIQPALTGADFLDRKGRNFAWYVFAGGEERLMLRNIFLDGSTFQSSASVQKKQYVGDFTGGLAVLAWCLRFSVSYTQRTHEFARQRGNDEFLSVMISTE